jgi:hypothetical protein
MMEHFVIDLYDTLLRNELGDDSPYVSVGTQLRDTHTDGRGKVPLHYSGNFWLAKCAFINTLARIDTLDHGNRYLAEFWISNGPEFARHKNCWAISKEDECDPPGFNTYSCMLNRSAYESYRSCREEPMREAETRVANP